MPEMRVTKHPTSGRVQINGRCPRRSTEVCQKSDGRWALVVEEDAFKRWQAGAFVQDAFPNMPADDREKLVTGTCGPCWDDMFSEEER